MGRQTSYAVDYGIGGDLAEEQCSNRQHVVCERASTLTREGVEDGEGVEEEAKR
jgi:hypothetical protein